MLVWWRFLFVVGEVGEDIVDVEAVERIQRGRERRVIDGGWR